MGAQRIIQLLLVINGYLLVIRGSEIEDYVPEFTVDIDGTPEEATEIAAKYGFINLGEIFPGVYHFAHNRIKKRSVEPLLEHSELLSHEPNVRSVQQQRVLKRVKRDVHSDYSGPVLKRSKRSSLLRRSNPFLNIDDPKWSIMWYLNRGGGLDMNVAAAWSEGYTGKGVVVTILDDGLEKDHPDIKRNYDPLASYDVNSHDEDPAPRYDLIDSNRHGTRCAGEVAAEANNSICALGIAYDAGIGGVRMLDGDVTDAVEARSLSLNPQHIDIFSASWGPDDDGKTVDGPGELATRAFVEGVTKGRGGKGSIFIWASGNGGRDHDDCNCDGYTNSIWTLSISSATENGFVPWYSEACSSTLASTYSSGSQGERQIVTTDLHHTCTTSHTGTSASAPLAAAICALALEANPNLTWRDMQHVVVRTARQANLKADDWQINGVGRNVSHAFGYGLMDAYAMVKLARTWQTVPPQQKCEVRGENLNKFIPAKSSLSVKLKVTDCPRVNFMEHVQARVTLSAVSRGDIQIFLISPSGTKSTLLALRPHDASRNGFHSWPFMSVHYWGEQPFGVWTLEVHNEGRFLATLSDWNLLVHGTEKSPESVAGDPSSIPQSAVEKISESSPSTPHSSGSQGNVVFTENENAIACISPEFLFGNSCVQQCPDGTYKWISSLGERFCRPCHYSCLTCFGPLDTDCEKCHGDSILHKLQRGENKGSETFCHPTILVQQTQSDKNWYIGLSTALSITLILIVILFVYLLKIKPSDSTYHQYNGLNARYTTLNVQNEDEKMYTDSNDEN
ncbi:furin-like protease 1 isoform X2 [Artemia franciscana]|uniref:furin n=1 Tax=Artemia franciscana TaxID=6661 RepID=A0AA88IFW7_ARTSF|nr:hypothetical protein QYM36_003428 [Artemia franciscana]